MIVPLVFVLSASAAPPATVLEHRVEVTVDYRSNLTETVTVKIRVDDPAACAAGVFVPPGLDGASDGGALVLEELLVVPADAVVGDVYTLSSRKTGGRGSHSGGMRSAPDLPVELASLKVTAPTSQPLAVWADPGATPTYRFDRRTRRVTMEWEGAMATRAAWSTYPDWASATIELEASVTQKLAKKEELGRDVAADLEGLGVSGITERAFERVELQEGPAGTWSGARSAVDISEARSGNAAERGLLLLSLLRIAGFDAKPALFRPSDSGLGFPTTVPAPALLPRPMVVIDTKKGQVLVDPAADRASVPDRPASLLGATVWIPGQLPFALPDLGVVDGRVTVTTTVSVGGDGSATWSSSVGASGAAIEYLRQLLAPLDDAGRGEALGRLVMQGRPNIERLNVGSSGVKQVEQPLKLTVSGFDPKAFESVDYGLRGTVAPTLAPALASWLPPNLQVTETVIISPPPALQILGSTKAASAFQPEAMVRRRYTREGSKALLEVDVARPYRESTPAMDAGARSFLEGQASQGVELLLFAGANKATMTGLKASTALSDAEKVVLTAQLWWSVGNEKKALKVLKKGRVVVGFDPLVDGVAAIAEPGDLRPWAALLTLSEEDLGAQMAVADRMATAGLYREAWLASAPLQASTNPQVQVSALLLAERVQGPTPAANDPQAVAAWKDPDALLAAAAAVAPNDPLVLFRQAKRALELGEPEKAEGLVQALVAAGQGGGAVEAMSALAAAQSGIPKSEVVERIEAAVRSASTDPEVIALAGLATAAVGAQDKALSYALTAARIANDDPGMWEMAIDRALAASDLGTAVYAARQASDLDSQSSARAQRLADLSMLLLDEESYLLGMKRLGAPSELVWPPSLDLRMQNAPPNALLGLMEVAEVAVAADPRLLSMRSQLRIDAGLLDQGARDGLLLADKYAWAEGWALAYAGTAGRQYSSVLQERLAEAAASQPSAQATRMEHGLITAASDPMQDAKRLGDDSRAKTLRDVVADPKAAAASIEGWPEGMTNPTPALTRGYKPNRVLSAVDGVVAFSNPDAGVAMMRVASISGLLPPPLNQLYSVNPQPLERLEDGGQVVRLDGGFIPLYAAIAFDGDEEVYGLGFSVESAKRALRDAL